MQSTRTIQLVSSCLMGREYFDSIDPISNGYFRILPVPTSRVPTMSAATHLPARNVVR